MSTEDYYCDFFYNVNQEEVTCRYCGETGLEWALTPRGWRLFDANGGQHTCRAYAPSADDFEVLP